MQNRIKKNLSKQPSRKPTVDDYQLVVRWSDEDHCYLAYAPALQGCVTHGNTAASALKKGQEAIRLWLTDALRRNDPIPKPISNHSGRMTVRLPASLHQRLAEEAEREGISINQWVNVKLAS